MAAPVAIQLAGAMEMAGVGGGAPKSPTSPVSPTSSTSPQQLKAPSPFINLNVREVFESNGLEQTKEISKRVNVEIEKKREELRTLVGERYRDLIDAADTIALMSTSSASIFEKLGILRLRMSTLPGQLNAIPRKTLSESNGNQKTLNREELEIAFELKLALESPRVVQKFLDEMKVIQATHVALLYERSLCPTKKPYKWAFLSNSGRDPSETGIAIKNLILKTCDEILQDFSSPPEKLAECIAAKQVLANCTCNEVITELLTKRIQMSEQTLLRSDAKDMFSQNVASTLNDIYVMFIDGQLYNIAVKEMRRPKIGLNSFGVKYSPKVVEVFHKETVAVEDAPRAGILAQILLASFVQPLKELLTRCFQQKRYLVNEESFQELSEYQKTTTGVLKDKTEDLMRIVLGTSSSLWTDAFYPVFQQKCEQVAEMKIGLLFQYLEEEIFPKYKKLDEDFDLVSYIWKATSLKNNQSLSTLSPSSTSKDVDLKLKCISPQVAEICGEVEEGFAEFLRDFQTLGDFSLKKYISSEILQKWKFFLDKTSSNAASLFLGRFVSSLTDLSPTVWKLMDIKDGSELRGSIGAISEKCWTQWSTDVADKFGHNLKARMDKQTSDAVAVFMPVAEEYVPEGEDAVKPSVRVPIQISHLLHSNLFQVCHELSRVGPQSVPKSVREEFRQSIGNKVILLYRELLDKSENPPSPQTALQLIFDIKFCQWFHLQLKELADPVIKNLQSVIDPFDMDIVTPKLKANLKRFLFETHLTLGLLFSEESHSFIAQNFKTKMNMSFPISNPSLSSPLPLLPV